MATSSCCRTDTELLHETGCVWVGGVTGAFPKRPRIAAGDKGVLKITGVIAENITILWEGEGGMAY